MMSSDFEGKLEKKRKKAEYKLEKKRLKEKLESKRGREEESGVTDPGHRAPGPDKSDEKTIQIVMHKEESKPWYKDSNWIRAIAALVTMVIVMISFYLTYIR